MTQWVWESFQLELWRAKITNSCGRGLGQASWPAPGASGTPGGRCWLPPSISKPYVQAYSGLRETFESQNSVKKLKWVIFYHSWNSKFLTGTSYLNSTLSEIKVTWFVNSLGTSFLTTTPSGLSSPNKIESKTIYLTRKGRTPLRGRN